MPPSPPRRPRLAISGSAGVGKTTLGERLAAELEVPFLPEGVRALIEAGLDLHALGRDGYRALIEDQLAAVERASTAAVREAGGFVADRSPLDFAAFWLYYGFACEAAATEAIVARARAALRSLDAVVLLPWGAVPLRADGVRSSNPWHQLHFQCLIEGLLERFAAPVRLLRLPAAIDEPCARAAWVRAALAEADGQ